MKRGLFWIMAALWIAGTARAQVAPEEPLPGEARKRLDTIVGEWESRWDWVDETGKVVYTEKGTEKAAFLIQDRVVEMTTTIVDRPAPTKAWMFFSTAEKKFYLVSVSREGDLWTFTGGLDKFVITSLPRTMPDGRQLMIRFSHDEVSHDQLGAVMEFSYDGGETWMVRCRQTLNRKA